MRPGLSLSAPPRSRDAPHERGHDRLCSADGAGITSWVAAGAGSSTLNGITAATGNQAGIANGAYTIQWNWDTLAGGSALKLASTSTAAPEARKARVRGGAIVGHAAVRAQHPGILRL